MERLLLDTCILIWWRADDPRLGATARRAIREASEVFVSAVAAWEISIKTSIGKLVVPELISSALPALGLIELPITIAHAERAGALPAHHKDPFDRMLVAQASHEGLTLVTCDHVFQSYDVRVLWA